MAHHIDRAIEALARKQHGAFNIQQVRELGGDRHLAKRRCASGAWIRLAMGVYALNGNPPTALRQMKAAELSVPGAAVSGTAAAVLHELPGFRLGRIEISAARARGSSSLARTRHRESVPTTMVHGIRVTTAAQTLCDVAESVSAELLGDAIDAARLARLACWDELAEAYRLAASRRSPSAAPFLRCLADRDPSEAVPASVLETRLERVLDDPRLPPRVRQMVAPWCASGEERVDVGFPTVRWIVEADGRRWHARVADFERDRRRDHDALRVGWGTTRFTAAQIDDPGYVVRTLLAAFAGRPVIDLSR